MRYRRLISRFPTAVEAPIGKRTVEREISGYFTRGLSPSGLGNLSSRDPESRGEPSLFEGKPLHHRTPFGTDGYLGMAGFGGHPFYEKPPLIWVVSQV